MWRRILLVGLLAALVLPLAGCNGLRALFPKKDYDMAAPTIPASVRKPAVLLFSKTNGFRHEEAIPAANATLKELAEAAGFSVFATENGAVFNARDLARFDVVVWNNTSGDTLDAEQKQAWKTWLERGGGALALHGAGGDPSYDWAWHPEEFIRAQFTKHIMGPQFQEAKLVVENKDHPATAGLPGEWMHTEEWYSFEESPRGKGVDVLLRVDESSYEPRFRMMLMDEDISMGDHPVAWSHCVEHGRVVYSALGHQAAAWSTPEMRSFLRGALLWAAGSEGAGCEQ